MKDACNGSTSLTNSHITTKNNNISTKPKQLANTAINCTLDSAFNNTVLLIGESACQLKQFQQSLHPITSSILIATNSQSAKHIIKQSKPAAIVIAEQLADTSGIRLCRWLLKYSGQPTPFILLVTDSYPNVPGITDYIDWIHTQHQPALLRQRIRNPLTMYQLQLTLTQSQQQLTMLQNHLDHAINAKSQQQIKERDAVIFSLAKLVEAKDNETGSHLERISQYAEILATAFKKPSADRNQQWVDHIKATAILHDVGKIGIPDHILRKPSKLSVEERSIMNQHPLIGGQALRDIGTKIDDANYLHIAADIAEAHHEKWDGSGYPHGLSGHTIPLAARLVAVADVYDALRSSRAYKAPLDHEAAKTFILAESGKHFDPEVVAVFLNHEAQFAQVANELQE